MFNLIASKRTEELSNHYKFMKICKTIAESFSTCLSKHYGAIIVKNNEIISTGTNGISLNQTQIIEKYIKSPNYENDKIELFSKGWFYSKLLKKWVKIINKYKEEPYYIDKDYTIFKFTNNIKYTDLEKEKDLDKHLKIQKLVKNSENNGGEIVKKITTPTCPRYIFGSGSGNDLHICNCSHAEENAIVNAAKNGAKIYKTTMYSYSPVACDSCARMISNSGIKTLVCLEETYKSYHTNLILRESKINLITLTEEI